jgi:dCTP diphosphatase
MEIRLRRLQDRLAAFAAHRDWEQFHTPKNLVMALTGEVGELAEIFQWLTPAEAAAVMTDPTQRSARQVGS